MSSEPHMTPYARHIFICVGAYCDPDDEGETLYEKLRGMLGDLGNYRNPVRVKRGTTPCLGVCAGGPIVVVYPDGIWYHHVDEHVLGRIVEEHLRNDEPVKDYIFHRLDTSNAGSTKGATENG